MMLLRLFGVFAHRTIKPVLETTGYTLATAAIGTLAYKVGEELNEQAGKKYKVLNDYMSEPATPEHASHLESIDLGA